MSKAHMMTDIITITFNPCIDKSTSVPVLKPDSKLSCTPPVFEPGGGGINVARAIKKLGGKAMAVYPSGGYSGKFLNILLAQENIPELNIETKQHTRENMIVLDKATNQQYRFGMPGQYLSKDEWQQCLQTIEENHSEFIVDSSGEALRLALEGGVYLIKPNLGELSILSGKEIIETNDIAPLAKDLIGKGNCEIVVVSMGALGAMLISRESIYKVDAPIVKGETTVGAGDSMVAGIVLCMSQGKNLLEALQYGVACGTAATLNAGTALCDNADVDRLYELIKEEKKFK